MEVWLIAIKKGNLREAEKKGSKGIWNTLWGLHIGIFWKIDFINPPEVQGRLLLNQKRQDYNS